MFTISEVVLSTISSISSNLLSIFFSSNLGHFSRLIKFLFPNCSHNSSVICGQNGCSNLTNLPKSSLLISFSNSSNNSLIFITAELYLKSSILVVTSSMVLFNLLSTLALVFPNLTSEIYSKIFLINFKLPSTPVEVQAKSLSGETRDTKNNLNESALYLLDITIGSTTFPIDLDITWPSSPWIMPWLNSLVNGSLKFR